MLTPGQLSVGSGQLENRYAGASQLTTANCPLSNRKIKRVGTSVERKRLIAHRDPVPTPSTLQHVDPSTGTNETAAAARPLRHILGRPRRTNRRASSAAHRAAAGASAKGATRLQRSLGCPRPAECTVNAGAGGQRADERTRRGLPGELGNLPWDDKSRSPRLWIEA